MNFAQATAAPSTGAGGPIGTLVERAMFTVHLTKLLWQRNDHLKVELEAWE